MKVYTKDMTKGSPIRLILFFTFPLLLGNLFQQGYMITDSIIVGRGVGVQALASLGATDWIYWLFLWAVQGFTSGFSVRIAQAFGAGDLGGVRKTTAMVFLLCAVFGLVLTAAGLLLTDPLLTLLRTETAIFNGSQIYLNVMFAGMLAVVAYNMGAAILRCLGDSRTPLIAMIVAAVLNVALDAAFVLVFHWGIFGAAFATVLAQFFAFLYCAAALRRLPVMRLHKSDWKADKQMLKNLVRLGIPAAFQYSIISVGGMVLQSVINGYGFVLIAGFTATNKLYGVLESTSIALGQAMVTYMGQNSGAKKIKRIDQGMRGVTILSALFSTAIAVVMIAFGRNILSLFVSAGERDSAQVIDIAYRYLFIMCCPLFLLFSVNIYRSALQGLSKLSPTVISGSIEMIMRIGVALILPRLIGQAGIFFAEVAAWGTAGLFMIIYYYSHIGRIKQEISGEPAPR